MDVAGAMHEIFKDRDDAGRHLAKKLAHCHAADAVILAIPRGGIPVAAVVAHRLRLEWGVIVVRKLPIPWSPEAGFGAVAADGSVVLNEAMVHGLKMRQEQIDEVVREVRAELARRSEFMLLAKPPPEVSGRCAIVVDDGLASGYTMLAAIKSLREGGASRVVAAAPVASRSAAALVGPAADECVFEIVSPSVPFAVADFYLNWHDLTDEEIAPLIAQ